VSRRDSIARFRQSIAQHFAGSQLALDNAKTLLDVAEDSDRHSTATASFIASLAAEELGKAILLLKRQADLIYNAEFRVHSKLFSDALDWTDGSIQPQSVLPWSGFVGRAGTHGGGLRDHRAKLQAVRDYYQTFHPQAKPVSDDTLELVFVDMFAGFKVEQVRAAVERSVYLSWDDASHDWRLPVACIPNLTDFVTAMRNVADGLTSSIDKGRTHSEGRVQYIVGACRQAALKPADVFLV